jgi:hypothetical protein
MKPISGELERSRDRRFATAGPMNALLKGSWNSRAPRAIVLWSGSHGEPLDALNIFWLIGIPMILLIALCTHHF